MDWPPHSELGESTTWLAPSRLSIRPSKTRHTVLVLGMYVQPPQRGHGVGLALMKAAIAGASARPEIQSLNLTHTEGNVPALRLYRSVGFVTWGVQPAATRTDTGLKGKVHMSLALPQPPAAV